MMKTTTLLSSALALALALASPLALAHKEGDFIVRAGAAWVAPQDDSSNIRINGVAAPGTEATVNNDTQLGLTLGYMLTDHVGVELLAATPFQHRVSIAGVAPGIDGKLADIKHLPPTLTLQYYPMAPGSKWQPYVGAGINYTTFFDESLTGSQRANGFSNLKLDDSWGLALQFGTDYMITDRLMVNAALWYVDIETTATVNLGANRVAVDVDVDPWVFMVGVGYRF